jgi:DNA-binding NarL/FixJ family response regulator
MPQVHLWERDATLAAIDRLLAAARTGQGGSLFIVADAGLGKTAMVERAAVIARPDFQVGVGRGDAAESNLPFGIIDQAMRGLGFRPSDPARGQRSPLQARSARRYASHRFLERRSSATLLLLDDLHWADEDSLALLAYLCRRIGALPVGVLGTLRPWPNKALQTAAAVSKDGEAEIAYLAPLTESASAAMVSDRADRGVSPSSARRIARLAGGNPFLIEQAIATLQPGRTLPRSTTGRATTQARLLHSWFDGATPDEQRFAQAASVLGSRFRSSIALSMAELPRGTGDRAVEALTRGGFIRSDRQGWSQFAHPLLRQVVYEEMPAPVRERWHANAFRLLAAAGADPSEAAEHAARAGLLGDLEAVDVLAKAGRDAMAAGAIGRARQRLMAAADVAGSRASADLLSDLGQVLLESGDGRRAVATFRRLLAMSNLDTRTRAAARRMLGRALFVNGAVRDASDAFAEAVATSLPENKSEAVRALLDQAFVSWPSGGPAQATPFLEHARALALESSPALRSRVDTGWAFSRFVSADLSGIEVLEQAAGEAFAHPEADTTDFAWSWGTLGTFGNMAKWTERFPDAFRAYDVGMESAERLGLPVAIAAVAVMHADTCLRTGNLVKALQLADWAMLHRELAPERAVWAAITQAYVAAEMGEFDQCAEWFRRASAMADPNPDWAGRLWLLHIEAVLAMHDRRTDDACALFDRLRALATKLQVLEPCIVPWAGDAMTAYGYAQRIDDVAAVLAHLDALIERVPCRFPRIVATGARAALTQAEGKLEATQALLEEAIALATESGMPLLEARLRLRTGALLRRTGQKVAARPLLLRALESAEAAGAEGIARKAAEELDLAGGRPRPRELDPDALTLGEQRVRALAELGVRTKQIAKELNVSVNTVETHQRHIYQKLNIHSQQELMALARSRPAGIEVAQPPDRPTASPRLRFSP